MTSAADFAVESVRACEGNTVLRCSVFLLFTLGKEICFLLKH